MAAVDYDALATRLYPVGTTIDGGKGCSVTVSSVAPLYGTPFVSLREVTFIRSDGSVFMRRAVLIMPDDGLVIPVFPDGTLGLIKVFRPGWSYFGWEFPQVRMEDGESYRAAAIRCAAQEFGLVGEPTAVLELNPFPTMPDRVTEMVHPSVVRGEFNLSSSAKPEIFQRGRFTQGEVRHLIDIGEMMDPVCITSFDRYIHQKA